MFIGLANSNLGRVAARAGRQSDAANRLRDARSIFRDMGASSMLLEADAREVERAVIATEPHAALELAADVRARTERFGGMPYLLAMVDRLCGYALCQLGDLRGGWTRLEASLDQARSAPVDYEIALTLEAMTRIAPLIDVPNVGEMEKEAGEIFSRLGIVSTPIIPASAT
jgi:hypothetical protein